PTWLRVCVVRGKSELRRIEPQTFPQLRLAMGHGVLEEREETMPVVGADHAILCTDFAPSQRKRFGWKAYGIRVVAHPVQMFQGLRVFQGHMEKLGLAGVRNDNCFGSGAFDGCG